MATLGMAINYIVADPSPPAAFNLERDGLHACSFVEFLVRDSQKSPETLIFKKPLASDICFG